MLLLLIFISFCLGLHYFFFLHFFPEHNDDCCFLIFLYFFSCAGFLPAFWFCIKMACHFRMGITKTWVFYRYLRGFIWFLNKFITEIIEIKYSSVRFRWRYLSLLYRSNKYYYFGIRRKSCCWISPVMNRFRLAHWTCGLSLRFVHPLCKRSHSLSN